MYAYVLYNAVFQGVIFTPFQRHALIAYRIMQLRFFFSGIIVKTTKIALKGEEFTHCCSRHLKLFMNANVVIILTCCFQYFSWTPELGTVSERVAINRKVVHNLPSLSYDGYPSYTINRNPL